MKLDVPPQSYRPNVGLMLIGPGRRVFVGQRLNQPDAWQMPQGGVDKGEMPVEAACRELGEEVGTTKAQRAYARRAYPLYRPFHVQRAMAMVLKAVGLGTTGWLNAMLTHAGLWFLRSRAAKYAEQGA